MPANTKLIPAVLLTLSMVAAVSACPKQNGTDGGSPTPTPEPAEATREDVSFAASDGKNLTGYMTFAPQAPVGSPGVVLVHQFQQDDEQWGDLPDYLALNGFRVLAFNLRGHGDSDAYDGTLSDILNDPDGAPRDLRAAVDYLAGAGGADAERIAVVGTSIGANLAVVAAIEDLARTYVAFSARLPPVENLAGQAAQGMRSVFYLAGETDPGGQAADSQTMLDRTADPKQLHVYPGVSDHGITILKNQRDDARSRLLLWLQDTL